MAFSISSSWQEKKVSSQTFRAINYPANLAWRNLHIASQILRIPSSPSATVCCLRSQHQPVQNTNDIHGQCKSKSGDPRRYLQAFQQSRSDKCFSERCDHTSRCSSEEQVIGLGKKFLSSAAMGDGLYSMPQRYPSAEHATYKRLLRSICQGKELQVVVQAGLCCASFRDMMWCHS